jgi:hypothetical protein
MEDQNTEGRDEMNHKYTIMKCKNTGKEFRVYSNLDNRDIRGDVTKLRQYVKYEEKYFIQTYDDDGNLKRAFIVLGDWDKCIDSLEDDEKNWSIRRFVLITNEDEPFWLETDNYESEDY